MSLSGDLQAIADQAANQYGIPVNLFEAQINQESGGNPGAINGSASGIAQFIPSTAAEYGVNTSDPTSSLYGAAAYDANLYSKTGSYVEMLQSYGTVPKNGTPTDSQSSLIQLASSLDNGGTAGTSSSVTPSTDDPYSIFNSLSGVTGQNSLGVDPYSVSGNTSYGGLQAQKPVDITTATPGGISGLVTEVEQFFESGIVRFGVIILGLILVAVALTMFKPVQQTAMTVAKVAA